MLSCKEVTQLVSESLDRKLPLRQRLGVRMHLFFCKACAHFQEQMLFLRQALRRYAARAHDSEPYSSASLPPEVRDRVKKLLREQK